MWIPWELTNANGVFSLLKIGAIGVICPDSITVWLVGTGLSALNGDEAGAGSATTFGADSPISLLGI